MNFGPERLGIHFKNRLAISEYSYGSPIKQGYSQLDYFKRVIKAHGGQDADAKRYIERAKTFTDKPLDGLGILDIREIRRLLNFPSRLEIHLKFTLFKNLGWSYSSIKT